MSIDIVEDKSLQIFDLGNVLVEVDAHRTIAAFRGLGMPNVDVPVSNSHVVGGVFSLYCDGKVSTADFIKGVRSLCCPLGDDRQIADAWNAMLGCTFDDAIEVVRRQRDSGKIVALLSNSSDLHANYVRELFGGGDSFDSLFDAIFFSHEIGMSKPKPQTWQMVLDHFGVAASDAAFYDDSQINVDAAQALGIESRLVKR